MRVFSRKTVLDFGRTHAAAAPPLLAWFGEVEKADWSGPNDVKARYPSASVITDERIVFNIKGNSYRVVVAIKYKFHAVYIRFIGTHAEYDEIDARSV